MRKPTLIYHGGTLTLHPPPRGKSWIDFAIWDDRVSKFRIEAINYRLLVESLQKEGIAFDDQANSILPLELVSCLEMSPYPHQLEALDAWKQNQRRGVVVLPTAAGKTYLAQLALEATPRTTLILVPTLDLMHQWYAHLLAAFPKADVGLLGGGSHDRSSILVATYDSAAIHIETLGNRYGLLIFDECHHLPTDFYRVIAELSIAPYRLGLTATVERSDGRHHDLMDLIGPIVYRKSAYELSQNTLAEYQVVSIKVKLSAQERDHYHSLIKVRNDFLSANRISLSGIEGWHNFVKQSGRSPQGRAAMLAHRQAKEIALGTESKFRLLSDLLVKHYPDKTLIFTNDNATVYRISQQFLIPAITHQTDVKERYDILSKFKSGEYKTLVASHVLNEGVDVPDATIAIILSGTGSQREFIQRMGRILRRGNNPNKRAILYEVVAENTTEEKTSERRKESIEETSKPKVVYSYGGSKRGRNLQAAESKTKYQDTSDQKPES